VFEQGDVGGGDPHAQLILGGACLIEDGPATRARIVGQEQRR
jgi:hypothetical protein